MRRMYRPLATDDEIVLNAAENVDPNEPEQLAALIARGEMPFPTDLTTTEAYRLVARVRQLRQQRLLAFIAELIARDILHTPSKQKDLNNAP